MNLQDVKEMWAYTGLTGYQEPAPGLGERLLTLLDMIQARMECHLDGHNWVDQSYGGPESGCMAGYCTRCGYSFHTTLY